MQAENRPIWSEFELVRDFEDCADKFDEIKNKLSHDPPDHVFPIKRLCELSVSMATRVKKINFIKIE